MVTFTMNLICSDCPVEDIGILNSHMGSIKHHVNILGPSQETYKEATKTKTISFVRKIYVHWNLTRWEKQKHYIPKQQQRLNETR